MTAEQSFDNTSVGLRPALSTAEVTSQSILLIINDGPYGNERSYNALRLALNLVRRAETTVRVFLIGDGVACAKRGQQTPNGYYNIERMMASLARRGEVAV